MKKLIFIILVCAVITPVYSKAKWARVPIDNISVLLPGDSDILSENDSKKYVSSNNRRVLTVVIVEAKHISENLKVNNKYELAMLYKGLIEIQEAAIKKQGGKRVNSDIIDYKGFIIMDSEVIWPSAHYYSRTLALDNKIYNLGYYSLSKKINKRELNKFFKSLDIKNRDANDQFIEGTSTARTFGKWIRYFLIFWAVFVFTYITIKKRREKKDKLEGKTEEKTDEKIEEKEKE